VRSSASLAELEALGVSESARWTVKVGAVTQDITARMHSCDGLVVWLFLCSRDLRRNRWLDGASEVAAC
jgi:hypothetical protein